MDSVAFCSERCGWGRGRTALAISAAAVFSGAMAIGGSTIPGCHVRLSTHSLLSVMLVPLQSQACCLPSERRHTLMLPIMTCQQSAWVYWVALHMPMTMLGRRCSNASVKCDSKSNIGAQCRQRSHIDRPRQCLCYVFDSHDREPSHQAT